MDAKIVCLNPTPKLIYPRSNGFDIEMKIYDITTLSGNICRLTSINEPKDVLKKIDKASLENVKVALYYFIFDNGEKSEIAKLLKSYYQKRDIPFFCCNADSIYYSSLLLAYVKEYGENVIEDSQTLLIIYDDRKYSKEISARSMEIKKTNDYFYFDDIELITDYTLEYSDEEFKKKFIKTSTVFVYFEGYISGQPNAHEKHTLDLIAAKIKDKTIRIINEDRMYFERNAITSKALKYIGKKPFKYDFASIAYYEFILGAFEPWMKTSQNQSFYHKCLISVNQFEIIPLKKTIVFYETFEKIVCADGNGNEYEKIEQPAVTEIGLAATFVIDSLHSPSVTVHQPAKDVDNAVIIKLDILEFSVEIIQNGKLQSIDLDKVPSMISFADGKVQVGEEAAKIKETKNSFVVSDLWIIASGLEYDGLEYHLKPDWGFTIKRDAKHQKYIFFDTFCGRRKATVSFLIALIIKWAVAKAEMSLGRMPETVVIVTHRLRRYLRYELEKACKQTKLENIDMQVHQYKIVQVKEK